MPARPSIAAAVEPARPPPTIAISVYRMVCLCSAALSLRRKRQTNLEGHQVIGAGRRLMRLN